MCGACTVLVDNEPVRACLMFAVQADGAAIPHRRRAGRRRDAAPAAAGLLGKSRAAMRLLYAGLPDALDLAARARRAARRRDPAPCAVVESVPLYRLSEHHQGGHRGPRVRSGNGRTRALGQAPRRSAAAARRRPLRRRPQCPGPIVHARGARAGSRSGRIVGIDLAAALAAPGVAAAWTGADVAAMPPIDFRQVRVPRPAGLPPADPGAGRSCAMPASRSRVLFADDPYRAEDAAELVVLDIAEQPPCLVRNRSAGALRRRARQRGGGDPQAVWRHRRGIRAGRPRRRARARGRAP